MLNESTPVQLNFQRVFGTTTQTTRPPDPEPISNTDPPSGYNLNCGSNSLPISGGILVLLAIITVVAISVVDKNPDSNSTGTSTDYAAGTAVASFMMFMGVLFCCCKTFLGCRESSYDDHTNLSPTDSTPLVSIKTEVGTALPNGTENNQLVYL